MRFCKTAFVIAASITSAVCVRSTGAAETLIEHEVSGIGLVGNDVAGPGGGPGAPRGGCPEEVVTYTDAVFPDPGAPVDPQQLYLFGGIVETEIFGASYTLDAAAFPVTINMVEFGFGQLNATVTTTTQWTLIIYQGLPPNLTIVETVSSNGNDVPHIVLPPGSQGQITPVQPLLPFVVQDNGSHSFTVGIRIDEHNNPPVSACDGGFTPARCCTHNPASNAFPLQDASGFAAPNSNWLWASNCGPFSIPTGWHLMSEFGLNGGDWLIRVKYSGSDCGDVGACCASDGSCEERTQSTCDALAGTWQGAGSACSPDICPEPDGACCSEVVGCFLTSAEDCAATAGGTFLGPGSACGSGACNGACCNATTGFCVVQTAQNCAGFGGQFQGVGVLCSGPSGNQCPSAACCLSDGTCVTASPAGCAGLSGIYHDGEACINNPCPAPIGACCLTVGGCIESEEDPCVGFGHAWAGPGTSCESACQAPCAEADGDVNLDSAVDGRDVGDFAAAVLGASGTPEQVCHGDFNESGALDAGDIPGLVNALLVAP